MATKKTFEQAFSTLHASPDTLMEVQRKMQQKKQKGRHLIKGAVIALAAALILSVAFAAAKIMGGTLHRADGVNDNIIAAFGNKGISTQKAVVFDSTGKEIYLPDMVREQTDRETVSRLVGENLCDVEGILTAGNYTLTLQSFLMDEQGMGVLTCQMENPNGIAYQDGGYGQVGLPVGLVLWQEAERKNHMDTEVYLNAAESTDTCLQLVVYFGSFQPYQSGEPVYVSFNEIGAGSEWQMMELQPQVYLPTASLSADGHTVTVSALGMTVENPVSVADELIVRELVLHFMGGTDYAVVSETLRQSNEMVNYWQGNGSGFPAVCYVFNRLVDVDALSSVTLEGSRLTADNAEMQVALEYGR